MKVQRYSPHKGMGDGMVESNQGRFMLFDDYQAFKSELIASCAGIRVDNFITTEKDRLTDVLKSIIEEVEKG